MNVPRQAPDKERADSDGNPAEDEKSREGGRNIPDCSVNHLTREECEPIDEDKQSEQCEDLRWQAANAQAREQETSPGPHVPREKIGDDEAEDGEGDEAPIRLGSGVIDVPVR